MKSNLLPNAIGMARAEAERLFREAMELIDSEPATAALKLKAVLKIAPGYLPGQINLGNALAAAGDTQKAIAVLTATVAKHPTSFHAFGSLAMVFLEDRQNTRAIDAFRKALSLNGDWSEGWYNLGNLLSDPGASRDEAEAIACYEKAITLDPSSADTNNNLALCLLGAGRVNEAIKHAQKACGLEPTNAPALHNLASTLHISGDLDGALSACTRALAIHPAYHECLSLQAILRATAEHEPAMCIQPLCAALQHAPRSSNACHEYALRLLLALNNLPLTDTSCDEFHATALQWVEERCDLSTNLEAHTPPAPSSTPFSAGIDSAIVSAIQGKVGCVEQQIHDALGLRCSAESISQYGLWCMLFADIPGHVHITHKVKLHRTLSETSTRAPATPWTRVVAGKDSLNNALELLAATITEDTIVFLKDPHMQRGQGIQILSLTPGSVSSTIEQAQLDTQRQYVLQQAVQPLLLNERKFGLRVHALLVHSAEEQSWRGFTFRESVLTMGGKGFIHASTDPILQITCTSVQRSLPGFLKQEVKGAASEMWPEYHSTYPHIQESVARTLDAAIPHLSPGRGVSFQIFGFDFLIDTNGSPILLEVNAAPQFGDPQSMSQLRDSIALPLINSLPVMIAGCAPPTNKMFQGWDLLELQC